jgi:hypothetical protein
MLAIVSKVKKVFTNNWMVTQMGEKQTAEITPPRISEKTMKEMAAFFARTSVPRIIESMQSEGKHK